MHWRRTNRWDATLLTFNSNKSRLSFHSTSKYPPKSISRTIDKAPSNTANNRLRKGRGRECAVVRVSSYYLFHPCGLCCLLVFYLVFFLPHYLSCDSPAKLAHFLSPSSNFLVDFLIIQKQRCCEAPHSEATWNGLSCWWRAPANDTVWYRQSD